MLKEHWCVHVLIQSRSRSPIHALRSHLPPQLSLTNAVGFFFFPSSFFFFYMLIGGEAAVSWSPWCEIIHCSMGGGVLRYGAGRRDRGGRQTGSASKFRMVRAMLKRFQEDFLMTFHFFRHVYFLEIFAFFFCPRRVFLTVWYQQMVLACLPFFSVFDV